LKICMLGIRRSGNSPIRNWITEQFEGSRQFINATPDIMSHLDQFEEKDFVISFEEMPPQLLEQVECDKKVLILRDPFNLAATRVKHYDLMSSGKKWVSPNAIALWKMYAEEFIKPKSDFICINYNRFLTDIEYRKEISKELGGKFSDESLDFVDDNGQGSSFDGMDFDGNAREMPVFERWKAYADVEAFRELFTPEIIKLSKEIFGEESWTMLYS